MLGDWLRVTTPGFNSIHTKADSKALGSNRSASKPFGASTDIPGAESLPAQPETIGLNKGIVLIEKDSSLGYSLEPHRPPGLWASR